MLVSKGGRGIVCVANLLFVLIFIMQVSGEGEMSSLKMRTLATAMTLSTPHEGKLTNDHIWKMCRHRHPEYIKPARAVDNKDQRVDWLTYNNIIKWMKRAKKFLLDIGMAKDEPGIIRKWLCLYCIHILQLTSHLSITSNADGVESEVSLVHDNDAAWFITLDETHHEFTTAGKKGSASHGKWVNESFPRSGERNILGNFHTTGVYGTTLAGEALPPLYILSTLSQNKEDYKVDP